MEVLSENNLKDINDLGTNASTSYQNKIRKSENIIKNNFSKIDGLLKQFINSNIKIEQKDLEDNFANNLFIPSFFKNKRFNEINNSQKIGNNNNNTELKLIENSKKENKKETNYFNNILNNNPKKLLNNISSDIITQNNNLDQNLNKISSHINLGNNILGKKRKIDHVKENNEIKIIHEEIKKIYNEYMQNNKIKDKSKQNIFIYNHSSGYFETEETIIIQNKPFCVIYLNREDIIKIYLIKEQNNYENEKDIKSILEKVKSELKCLC
jgi:hypothetical protein